MILWFANKLIYLAACVYILEYPLGGFEFLNHGFLIICGTWTSYGVVIGNTWIFIDLLYWGPIYILEDYIQSLNITVVPASLND